MKIVKSNSKTQYNFCGTNKLSFKERVIAGNSYIPTKQDMSVDALREPGNSYVDKKVNMTKQEQSKSSQNAPQQSKQQTSDNNTNKSGFVRVNKPVTFGSLVKSLSNLGKSDFSKPDVKYDQQCLDNYEEIGIPRDEAKKKRYGCQVNSSGKPWDTRYDELDREADKFKKENRKSAKSNNLNPKPKLVTRSSPDSKSRMDDLFADMDNTIKQHCGDAKNCRITEANGQRSITAWN